MSERDQDQGALSAIEWAVTKYWKEKSDEQLAIGLSCSVEEIVETRKLLNIERPKGNASLKEFARKYLESLSDVEKLAFIKKLPEDLVWKMSEGNPANENPGSGPTLVQINITPQLEKIYGSVTARVLPDNSEVTGLPA